MQKTAKSNNKVPVLSAGLLPVFSIVFSGGGGSKRPRKTGGMLHNVVNLLTRHFRYFPLFISLRPKALNFPCEGGDVDAGLVVFEFAAIAAREFGGAHIIRK